MAISALDGGRACPLGLAGHPEMEDDCVPRALEAGVNLFFGQGGDAFETEWP